LRNRPRFSTRPEAKRIGEASPFYDEDVRKQPRLEMLQKLSPEDDYNSNLDVPLDLFMSDMTLMDEQVSIKSKPRSTSANLKSRSSGYESVGRPTPDCVCRCGK